MSKALSGWIQTAFRCLALVTCAITIKFNSILFYSVMATENKLYAKSSERKRYKIPWQNITGEIQTALTLSSTLLQVLFTSIMQVT